MDPHVPLETASHNASKQGTGGNTGRRAGAVAKGGLPPKESAWELARSARRETTNGFQDFAPYLGTRERGGQHESGVGISSGRAPGPLRSRPYLYICLRNLLPMLFGKNRGERGGS